MRWGFHNDKPDFLIDVFRGNVQLRQFNGEHEAQLVNGTFIGSIVSAPSLNDVVFTAYCPLNNPF